MHWAGLARGVHWARVGRLRANGGTENHLGDVLQLHSIAVALPSCHVASVQGQGSHSVLPAPMPSACSLGLERKPHSSRSPLRMQLAPTSNFSKTAPYQPAPTGGEVFRSETLAPADQVHATTDCHTPGWVPGAPPWEQPGVCVSHGEMYSHVMPKSLEHSMSHGKCQSPGLVPGAPLGEQPGDLDDVLFPTTAHPSSPSPAAIAATSHRRHRSPSQRARVDTSGASCALPCTNTLMQEPGLADTCTSMPEDAVTPSGIAFIAAALPMHASTSSPCLPAGRVQHLHASAEVPCQSLCSDTPVQASLAGSPSPCFNLAKTDRVLQ